MVAVVGLGAMGGAVAGHLVAAGYEVNGYDPSPEAGRRATTNGVTIFDDTAAAVAQAGFVITSLPDPVAVRSAWEGDRGIIASVAPGAVLVELSTIDPGTMSSVGESARQAGHRVIGCAVSGGPDEAASWDAEPPWSVPTADLEYCRSLADTIPTPRRPSAGLVGTGRESSETDQQR